jgi:L-ascorbate metabolism protein UlaG (beta-lactamase superfamily)
MSEKTLYHLASPTICEPLVSNWTAWPNVIAPVPASLHLLQYQLPTLQSFVDNPDLHVQACLSPELVGGPFVNLGLERVEEAVLLLNRMQTDMAGNIRVARELLEFQNWLVDRAHGESLVPYYHRLPLSLQGYAELVYDYQHRASVRLLEGLLYRSDYYHPELQSLRLFALRNDRARPYFLNTPRLLEEGQIFWNITFDDERVDSLFQLSLEPAPLGKIRELFSPDQSSDKELMALLSSETIAPPRVWMEDLLRIKYFGHACVLFERKGVSILTDPFISVRPTEGGIERYTYDDLPAKIDYVLVTHGHQDHFSLESLLRLRHRIGCLIVPRACGMLYGDVSLKLLAKYLGFRNVIELDVFESIAFEDGEITAIPFLGEHADIAHSKTAYVIRTGQRQILVAADADCLDINVYRNVRATLGPIDTVFIGLESVGATLSFAYGSLLPQKPSPTMEQTRRQHGCNAERALEILEAIGAERLYNYAMGPEPWMYYILGFDLDWNSPQLQESERLLSELRVRGFAAAERLYGKHEFYLDNRPLYHKSISPSPALELISQVSRDAEDDFIF